MIQASPSEPRRIGSELELARMPYPGALEVCASDPGSEGCENWDGFGTEYAYIHTGLVGTVNGTTVVMSKKGSGLADLVNPCIAKVIHEHRDEYLANVPQRAQGAARVF